MVKKAEEAISDSRKRTADTLFTDLESVALAIEGRDLNITEENFVPTAKSIQDTKERHLVTRSGLQGPQCCYAISTTYRQWRHSIVFDIFSEQYFSKYTASRSMSLLEMPMRQHTNTTKSRSTEICTVLQLPLSWERCNVRSNTGRPFESKHNVHYSTFNHSSLLRSASDLDCCLMAVLSSGNHMDLGSWENSGATRVSVHGLWDRCLHPAQDKTARTPKVLKSCWWRRLGRAIQTQRTSTFPRLQTSLGAPEQKSLDTINRLVLALPHSRDHSWDALQKLPWKVTREVGSQRRGQGAEDSKE